MAPNYEGQKFKVFKIGRDGDPMIRLGPGGKICFVEHAPDNVGVGSEIYIKGHIPKGGNSDFATYAEPPSALEQEAARANVPKTGRRPLTLTALDGIDSVVKGAAPSSATEYMLKIGPTERADNCATAYCPADLLQMNAYSALIELIKRPDDATIYRESTDRRLAAATFAIYQRAVADKAVAELQLTLGNEPITEQTTKKLIDYFRQTIRNRYSAAAVVKKGEGKSGEETRELVGAGVGAESCAKTPSTSDHYTAASTVGRKGRQG